MLKHSAKEWLEYLLRGGAAAGAYALSSEAWTMSDHGEYGVALALTLIALGLGLVGVWGYGTPPLRQVLDKPNID